MALAAALTVQPHLYIGDPSGRPLDNGSLYFGEPDKDPQEYPIDLFYDPNLTVAAAQPVKTKGGFMYANGNMIEIYAAEQSYSVKVLDAHGQLVFYKPVVTRTIDSKTIIKSDSFFIAPPNNDNGVNVFEYRDAIDLIWTIVPAGVYLKDNVIAKASITGDKIVKESITGDKIVKESITGDKIAKNAALNTPLLPNTYALTTLDAPNLTMDATGALTRSNDPLNASTRKVGTAVGNLVERGADGYPTNSNAIGVGQTWQDMTASRADGVIYTNTTGRPIVALVRYRSYVSGSIISADAYVDSVVILKDTRYSANIQYYCQLNFIIPIGATYSTTGNGSSTALANWSELR